MDHWSGSEFHLETIAPVVSEQETASLQSQWPNNIWPLPTNNPWPSIQNTPELFTYCIMQPSLSSNFYGTQLPYSTVAQNSLLTFSNTDTGSPSSSPTLCQCNGCESIRVLGRVTIANGSSSSSKQDLDGSCSSASTSAMSQDMNEDDNLNVSSLHRSSIGQVWGEQGS